VTRLARRDVVARPAAGQDSRRAGGHHADGNSTGGDCAESGAEHTHAGRGQRVRFPRSHAAGSWPDFGVDTPRYA